MDEYLKRWIEKAEKDRIAARYLFEKSEAETLSEAICFHCQQSAEKYLKAFLVFKNIKFGKVHNLEYLKKLCSEADADFQNLEVGNLSDFAVEFRYPDNFYTPDRSDIESAMRLSNSIKEFVIQKIGLL